MGNGVLYAAIVVVWAVVLVPMWLRRHEETAELRSVSRFSSAMRVLARREPRPARADQRYVVMPPRSRVAEVDVPNSPPPVRAPRHAGRAKLAARRRRLLGGLLGLVVLSLLAQPLDAVGWSATAVALALLVGVVVHLRVQARRVAEVDRRRRSTDERLTSRTRRFDAAGAVVLTREQRAAERAVERIAAEAEALEAKRREQQRLEAERVAAEGWQPTPVPLPTYVTKPKAQRTSSRTVDRGSGAWAAPAVPAPQGPVEEPAPGLDDELAGMAADAAQDDQFPAEHRRAVND